MNQTIQCLLSRVNHKLLFKNTFIEILLIYYKVQMFKVYTSMGFSIFSNVSITKINFRTFLGLKRNFVFVSSHSSFQIPPHTHIHTPPLSLYICVSVPVSYCLDYCSFVLSVEIGRHEYTNFLLFQDFFWWGGEAIPWHFYVIFRISRNWQAHLKFIRKPQF
jgi:hypothetical protein